MESIIPEELSKAIADSLAINQRIVIMTCGVAGSGKSALSKKILSTYPSFIRLSIDTYIFQHHGQYGRDYPPSQYFMLQDEATTALESQFQTLLEEGKRDVVLDFSFYNRDYRDEWRLMVGEGTRIVIVYFEGTEEVLWKRIEERSKGVRDADSAAEITREVLRGYVSGFEAPGRDEGEVVVVKVK